jgi:Fe-Mn family superoxide dismutase
MDVVLPPLPYALDALEPHLSRHTLAAHHDHHHATYVAKCRALVERTPLAAASLEDVVQVSAKQGRMVLFNAAAQAWNHAFYWQCLRPGGGGEAHGTIAALLEQSFGRQRTFSQEFVTAAGDQFGSGWAWLVFDEGQLKITATSNAQTPLLGSQVPLLTLDVWEHAYYLDYQHRRLDYIAAFLAHLVNWDFVNQNLVRALTHSADRETVSTMPRKGAERIHARHR